MAIINDLNSTNLSKTFVEIHTKIRGKYVLASVSYGNLEKEKKNNFKMVYFFRDFKRYWISEKPLKVITINPARV